MSEAIVKPPVDLVKGWEEVRHCAQLIREGKARIVVTKTTAITLGIGAITYFLKRTMNQVDNHGKEIQQLNMEVVKKNDLKESTEELKSDIKQIREDYTPKKEHEKDFDECRDEIKQIKAEYLTKDDFIREINKMDRKLDQMLQMMIDRVGK